MKNIDMEINNFGKIENAKFQVKPFTLIAGKNASGKSFLTRSLYSIFSSLNKDHLSIDIDSVIFSMQVYIRSLSYLSNSPSFKVEQEILNLHLLFKILVDGIDLIYHQSTLISQIGQKDELQKDIKNLQIALMQLSLDIESVKKYKSLNSNLKNLISLSNKLKTFVDKPNESLVNGLAKQLEKSLLNNFLVSSLIKLKNRKSNVDNITFNFGETIGNIEIESNSIKFALKTAGIDEFQRIDNVVYLESPVYWKIKDVIKGWVDSRKNPLLRRRLKHQQQELKKVPDYILDTFTLLDSEIISNNTNKDLNDLKMKIISCIGGHVQISDSGDIQFIEKNELNNEGYINDLHQTATGVVALGMIALLIDKHIIVPNSILIFDEPEVNLHPAWQKVMTDVLYHLSVAGVRIIMASHSFDMMENIEKLMDVHNSKDLDIDEHFSIIQLENGNTINNHSPIFKKLDAIKADLGMPLFDIFSS